jgi:hypothetical protein
MLIKLSISSCLENAGRSHNINDIHDGKRPLGRPRHRWKNNTKMAVQ